jgi:hypothetical protein
MRGLCLALALAGTGWIDHLVAAGGAAALANHPGLMFHRDAWETNARHGIPIRYTLQ